MKNTYDEACGRMKYLIMKTEEQLKPMFNEIFPDFAYRVHLYLEWDLLSFQFKLTVDISQDNFFYLGLGEPQSARAVFNNKYWSVNDWTDEDYCKEIKSDFNKDSRASKICDFLKKVAANSTDVISDWLKACSERVKEKYKEV